MKSFNIVTGEKGEGKTTTLLSIASLSPHPRGFVSIHRNDAYYLYDLERGTERLLMTTAPVFPQRWKAWYVDTSLFDEVYDRLSDVFYGPVYIDECGMMETEGLGYDRTLRMLMKRDVDIYITLRRPFIERFLKCYSIVDYRLIAPERRTEGD